MKIALVQQHTLPDQETNLQQSISSVREAVDQGAQLVAFAELSFQRFFPQFHKSPDVQTGAVDEWPSGLFEAELQVASLQNGYFSALVNRVGREEKLTFAGESFITGPDGRVISRAPSGDDHILYADLDMRLIENCPARKHFLLDRRPELYPL